MWLKRRLKQSNQESDEKQKLHEMKEQLLDYQEQQSMNQETEYEEEESQIDISNTFVDDQGQIHGPKR